MKNKTKTPAKMVTQKPLDHKKMENRKAEINNANKIELLFHRLVPVKYFETDNVKIPLFDCKDNEFFKNLCTIELEYIRKAIKEGNITTPSLHKSTDYVHLEGISETSEDNLILLFNDKFNEAKYFKGYKTKYLFAKAEIKDCNLRHSKCFDRFPIFYQWLDFLKNIEEREFVCSETEKKLKTLKPKQKKVKIKNDEINYNYNEIRLACNYSELILNNDSAPKLLLRFSQYTSYKTLLKPILRKNHFVLEEDKRANTIFLNDLKGAKRLLKGIKNTAGEKKLTYALDKYTAAYNAKYNY